MDNDELDLSIDEETEETEEAEEAEETEETEEAEEAEEANDEVISAISELGSAIRELRDIMVSIKDGFGILVENGATVKEPEEVLPPAESADNDDADEFENVLALDELDLDM